MGIQAFPFHSAPFHVHLSHSGTFCPLHLKIPVWCFGNCARAANSTGFYLQLLDSRVNSCIYMTSGIGKAGNRCRRNTRSKRSWRHGLRGNLAGMQTDKSRGDIYPCTSETVGAFHSSYWHDKKSGGWTVGRDTEAWHKKNFLWLWEWWCRQLGCL